MNSLVVFLKPLLMASKVASAMPTHSISGRNINCSGVAGSEATSQYFSNASLSRAFRGLGNPGVEVVSFSYTMPLRDLLF